MAEQSKETPKQPKEPKPKRAYEWGLTQFDALEAWAGKQVLCSFTSGAQLSGALVGYDQFHLTLKVGSEVVLVRKGALETLRAG